MLRLPLETVEGAPLTARQLRPPSEYSIQRGGFEPPIPNAVWLALPICSGLSRARRATRITLLDGASTNFATAEFNSLKFWRQRLIPASAICQPSRRIGRVIVQPC